MTFDGSDIEDLTAFAADHDDETWGDEPTRRERPSVMPCPDGDPVAGFRLGVLMSLGLWAVLATVVFVAC